MRPSGYAVRGCGFWILAALGDFFPDHAEEDCQHGRDHGTQKQSQKPESLNSSQNKKQQN